MHILLYYICVGGYFFCGCGCVLGKTALDAGGMEGDTWLQVGDRDVWIFYVVYIIIYSVHEYIYIYSF